MTRRDCPKSTDRPEQYCAARVISQSYTETAVGKHSVVRPSKKPVMIWQSQANGHAGSRSCEIKVGCLKAR
jgi:hypothetical protein